MRDATGGQATSCEPRLAGASSIFFQTTLIRCKVRIGLAAVCCCVCCEAGPDTWFTKDESLTKPLPRWRSTSLAAPIVRRRGEGSLRNGDAVRQIIDNLFYPPLP